MMDDDVSLFVIIIFYWVKTYGVEDFLDKHFRSQNKLKVNYKLNLVNQETNL